MLGLSDGTVVLVGGVKGSTFYNDVWKAASLSSLSAYCYIDSLFYISLADRCSCCGKATWTLFTAAAPFPGRSMGLQAFILFPDVVVVAGSNAVSSVVHD